MGEPRSRKKWWMSDSDMLLTGLLLIAANHGNDIVSRLLICGIGVWMIATPLSRTATEESPDAH